MQVCSTVPVFISCISTFSWLDYIFK